jgi:hypothetical protein
VDLISESPNDKSGWTPLRRKAQVDGIKRRLKMGDNSNKTDDGDTEPQDPVNNQDDEEYVPSVKVRGNCRLTIDTVQCNL